MRRGAPREIPAEPREMGREEAPHYAVRMSVSPWLSLPEAPSLGLGLDQRRPHTRHRRVIADADGSGR